MKLKDIIQIKDQIDCSEKNIQSRHCGYIKLKNCPICNKSNHFVLRDDNTYFSFSGCCKGGDSIDFMKESFQMSYLACLKTFGNNINVNNVKTQLTENDKQHLDNMNLYIKNKVDSCFDYLESIKDMESILKITEIKAHNVDDEYLKRYLYILFYFRSFNNDENTSKVVNKEALIKNVS